MESLKILVLDDEMIFRNEIKEFLENDSFCVLTAQTPSEAFKILEQESIGILILDLRLPEMDGLQVLQIVKQKHPDVEVIVITGHGDMDTVIQAMRLGAMEFFPKPFRLIDMRVAIQRSKRYLLLNSQLQQISHNYNMLTREVLANGDTQMLGASKAMNNVINLMSKVAQTDNTSVLITGESGTGKELVARGIHLLSNRSSGYFYAVNCSAIPSELFESEFFGHKKGSFTGASADKAGWFEIAHGGTLFLDEVVEMQPQMQAKLLRVLEERKVRRIGSSTDIPVDVRIVAATNQSMAQLIEEGKFRSDLFYRINSFEISLPPLRERREDIPILVDHFVKHLSQKLGKKIKSYDPRIIGLMNSYSFPGNIRELRNMIERAIILCDHDRIEVHNLDGLMHLAPSSVPMPQPETFDLAEIERSVIIKALERTGHKKTEAAALLNITRQSLDRRLEKYGIE